MSKTMQDKETKEKNELIKRLQEIKWFISSGDDRAIDIYPDYETLADFVFQREQEAERRGARSVFTKDELGTISTVFHFYKTEIEELNLRKPLIWGEVISLKEKLVKLLEEENGKQNAR